MQQLRVYTIQTESVCVVCQVLTTVILMRGMALREIQVLQAHSAESSAVSRSYATLLIPVHSLGGERSEVKLLHHTTAYAAILPLDSSSCGIT